MSEAEQKLIQTDVPPVTAAPTSRGRTGRWVYVLIAIAAALWAFNRPA